MLTLDVEWLTGVARAARDPSDPEPDWPPQPDRIFSALVASWGALNEIADGRRALEWLECQSPPKMFCVRMASARPAVDHYVPVNDQKLERALPRRRARQPRRFAVCALPEAPVHLRLIWDAGPNAEDLRALNLLASATSYVGHSASLVRFRFVAGLATSDTRLERDDVRTAPYPGRLAELKRLYDRHVAGDERARPRRSAQLPRPNYDAPRCNVFSPDWFVLAHAGGDRPDLLAAAALARRLRDAVMSVVPQPPAPWISGHEPDGAPMRDPHMAIAPLANIGWEHADGRLMGLAVILPHAVRSSWQDRTPEEWRARREFEGAFAKLMSMGDGAISLRLGRAGVWALEPELTPSRRSLDPHRYTKPAQVFVSVTPIALDRHLKRTGAAAREEAAELVARACAAIGLPEPSRVDVFKHSAVRGAPSARPASGAPSRPYWARPGFLKQRRLVHARIAFADAVPGPVILGAGRFVGLGFCLPVRDEAPR
ncbi:MAG: type I-U CRISPR-associated protein Csb2 [Nitratireductor sp.]